MSVTAVEHPSVEERKAEGEEALKRMPPSSHSGWKPAADRPDPVALLEEQDATREPDLVPVRHGRMLVSPFTFYRGAAKIMAADLKDTPRAGLTAQLCGDAHLSNFGVFASPERILLFDLNDFDETLPGPFEYDVKRMSASFTIAARNNGFSKGEARDVTLTAVASYRTSMAQFAEMSTMDVWYAHLTEDELQAAIANAVKSEKGKAQKKAAKKSEKKAEKADVKAHTRDSLQALSKLAELVDGTYRIVSQPPIVVPSRDFEANYGISPDELQQALHEQFRAYRATLQPDRRTLLERFEMVDMARKVVGVGSVGTRAFIVLLQGRDQHDPLFLQVKEATASVLEDHLPEESLQAARRARRAGPAHDAGGQRHLPGLDQGLPGEPLPLLAPAARHEGLGRGRVDDGAGPGLLRPPMRLDAGPCSRSVRRPDRDRGLSGQQRRLRSGDHRLLRALRRPEREGLQGLRQGGALRAAGGDRGRLSGKSYKKRWRASAGEH